MDKIVALKAFNPKSGFNRFKPGFKSVFDPNSLITKDEVIQLLQTSQERGTCPLLQYLRQILKILELVKKPSVFSQKEEDNCDDLSKLTEINWASENTEFMDNTHITLFKHYNEVLSWLKEPKVRILIFKNLQKVESFSLISSGLNATTYKVTFEEDIHAVLKVPKSRTDDNLYYEFRIGQNVNRFATIYPCFIQTYALFESKKTNIDLQNIQNMTLIHETQQIIGPTCKNSDKLALMIENIENPMTIENFYKEGKDLYDLYGILFQVYFPLFQLQDNFTHNDLNLDNVMLYKPFRDDKRYIEMKYHIGEKMISFKSQYIVKIIDYSRCFIKNFSKRFLNIVCNECEPECGKNNGYNLITPKYYLQKKANTIKEFKDDKKVLEDLIEKSKKLKSENTTTKNNEIEKIEDQISKKQISFEKENVLGQIFDYDNAHDPTKQNVSIDLWLLDEIKKYEEYRVAKEQRVAEVIPNLLTKYSNEIRINYGIEYKESTYDETRNVNNVTDAFKMLQIAMVQEVSNIDKIYEDWTLGATMDIYGNGRPYEYTVV